MYRILYTAFDVVPSPKGASTHILHFLRGLVSAGHQVHLITPGNGILPTEEEWEGAQLTRIPFSLEENFLSRACTFGKSVMEHIHSATPYHFTQYRSIWSGLPLVQEKLRHGYKTIFEVNGLPSVELKYHYPLLSGSSLLTKIREQELATLTLSDAILCPSEVTRAYLLSMGVSPAHISIIPNGFSARDFKPTPLSNPIGRVPVLLYIGTLADWQGLEVLVRAIPKILAEHSVRLRIVGRGRSRQRKNLEKQIRKIGLENFISLEPPVPHHQVPKIIEQADICVAPLGLNDRNVTQGCCPIKVIEYMASGRPIVASNLPVVRELLREDIDALFFSPDDPDDLARQISILLRDRFLAERLSISAAERARTRFTWHEAQKKLLKVYERLMRMNVSNVPADL